MATLYGWSVRTVAMSDFVVDALVVLSFVMIVASLVAAGLAASELRWKDPTVYSELNQPHLWYPNTAGFYFLFVFILLGEFKTRIDDDEIIRKCSFVQVVLGATVAAFMATVIFVGVGAIFLA